MTALQRQIDRLLAHRASEWHQMLENATPAQRAEFVRWLKKSPLHVQEYLATAYTDRVLHDIDPEHEQDVDALVNEFLASTPQASASCRLCQSTHTRGCLAAAAVSPRALRSSPLPASRYFSS